MNKRQQVLEVIQELPEDYLDMAFDWLQSLREKSAEQKRLQALQNFLDFVKTLPESQVTIEHRTWTREDAYDRS